MPRWLERTVAVATLALLVLEYFKPAPWTLGSALIISVGLLASGGNFAIALANRRAHKTDELTTLNLTGK
jgi:uncharacterized protein (DUF58 family)